VGPEVAEEIKGSIGIDSAGQCVLTTRPFERTKDRHLEMRRVLAGALEKHQDPDKYIRDEQSSSDLALGAKNGCANVAGPINCNRYATLE